MQVASDMPVGKPVTSPPPFPLPVTWGSSRDLPQEKTVRVTCQPCRGRGRHSGWQLPFLGRPASARTPTGRRAPPGHDASLSASRVAPCASGRGVGAMTSRGAGCAAHSGLHVVPSAVLAQGRRWARGCPGARATSALPPSPTRLQRRPWEPPGRRPHPLINAGVGSRAAPRKAQRPPGDLDNEEAVDRAGRGTACPRRPGLRLCPEGTVSWKIILVTDRTWHQGWWLPLARAGGLSLRWGVSRALLILLSFDRLCLESPGTRGRGGRA